jgi:Tfp pilus assembly protein PilN
MGKYHLNLSTRPFPAYRIVSFVMLAVFLVLVGISAGQVYGYLQYSDEAGKIRGTERNLRAEMDRLTKEELDLKKALGGSQAISKIGEVKFINSIVERRNFCWTCLLRHIENCIPNNVHLTSLKPETNNDGSILVSISAQGRSLSDLAQFIDRLQNTEGVFEKVNVAVENKTADEFSVVMTVPYYPNPKKDSQQNPGNKPSERKGD